MSDGSTLNWSRNYLFNAIFFHHKNLFFWNFEQLLILDFKKYLYLAVIIKPLGKHFRGYHTRYLRFLGHDFLCVT